jgi:hypothetical protein
MGWRARRRMRKMGELLTGARKRRGIIQLILSVNLHGLAIMG